MEFTKHAKSCYGDDVSTWSTAQVVELGMLVGKWTYYYRKIEYITNTESEFVQN